LIGQGKTNSEIAADLVLSKRTVETHVSNILSKLGLAGRGQIMLWAIERGLSQPPQ
jgi:DNA-binding NarL/FixJ family response regulator